MLGGDVEPTIQFIVMTYNKIAQEPVGREWMENLRDRQHLWYAGLGEEEKQGLREVA
jgi:hypothetical protein